MRIIKHNLDDILVISIVFDSQDDIESVRAFFGGSIVVNSIAASATPDAPIESARSVSEQMQKILDPLSKLYNR